MKLVLGKYIKMNEIIMTRDMNFEDRFVGCKAREVGLNKCVAIS